MFHPAYRMKRNGVPILSRAAVDGFARKFIEDFQPDVLYKPEPVNAERFLEQYLEAEIEYRYLSGDGRYLGMTVFQDHVAVPSFDPATGELDAVPVDARTVLIENSLLEEEGQEGRLRYTLAHEAGHLIFHATAFRMAGAGEDGNLFLCRAAPDRPENDRDSWTDFDWMEWQSDVFAASFLMPAEAVRAAVFRWKSRAGMLTDHCKSVFLAKTFGVSRMAALNRMRELNIPDEEKPFVSELTDEMLEGGYQR